MSTTTREFWATYLTTTSTYGTFEERSPEYQLATLAMQARGLRDDELIVDVGAGSCDMDHFLRTRAGWRGKYFPVDGATLGIDFNDVSPEKYLPSASAEWYVCLETLEHVYDPEALVLAMQARATRGVVVTTPNADIVDVVAVDSTHVMPIHPADLERWGFSVSYFQLNGRGKGDTLLGFWAPDLEDFPVG